MDVVKCLVNTFSLVGFPDELLSDCGVTDCGVPDELLSDCLIEITQAFLVECDSRQLKTSPQVVWNASIAP